MQDRPKGAEPGTSRARLAPRSTTPILVTGSHRGGTTWVGKMLGCSSRTYYLGELFNPHGQQFGSVRVPRSYHYISVEQESDLAVPIRRILELDFAWRHRVGIRSWLPSRLPLLRCTRRWWGFPRPIVKDPLAAMSAPWMARTLDMDVIGLIRHPAGFVYSLRKAGWPTGFRHFLEQPRLMDDFLHVFADQLEHPPTCFVERAALMWLCIQHVLTSYSRRHPKWQFWRVEDIAAAPVRAFDRIYRELDLPFTRNVRRQVRRHSFAGESSSTGLHSVCRNSVATVNKWRVGLDRRELESIRKIAEPVSHRYYSDQEWEKGFKARPGD